MIIVPVGLVCHVGGEPHTERGENSAMASLFPILLFFLSTHSFALFALPCPLSLALVPLFPLAFSSYFPHWLFFPFLVDVPLPPSSSWFCFGFPSSSSSHHHFCYHHHYYYYCRCCCHHPPFFYYFLSTPFLLPRLSPVVLQQQKEEENGSQEGGTSPGKGHAGPSWQQPEEWYRM